MTYNPSSAFGSFPIAADNVFDFIYTAPDAVANFLSSTATNLIIILIFVLVADAAIRFLLRQFRRISVPRVSSTLTTLTAPARHPIAKLASQAEQLVLDFQDLEKQLTTHSTTDQSKNLDLSVVIAPVPQKCAEFNRRPQLLPAIITDQARFGDFQEATEMGAVIKALSIEQKNNGVAFAAFCERLLVMNHMWKQERELKSLRAALDSRERALRSNAFEAFCDRLLLSNSVWKLEKEVGDLVEKSERMRRARVMGITRTAKKMVLDLRKEHLVEDLVKDMIAEVEEGKQEVKALRAEHEREIAEIHGEWSKDYRGLVRELERMKLGQEARLVEQEVANDMEDSLYDSLRASKRKAEVLEDKLWEYKKMVYAEFPSEIRSPRINASHVVEEYNQDADGDLLSEMSTSSTCISSRSYTPTSTKTGSASASPSKIFHDGYRTSSPSSRQVNDNPFAFKPIFVVRGKSTSVPPVNHSSPIRTQPLRRVAIKQNATLSLKRPSRMSASVGPSVVKSSEDAGRSTKRVKVQWRF